MKIQEITDSLVKRLNGSCGKILLINPVQVPRDNFDAAIARIQNYPCFPPYGPGLICRNLEDRGYISDIIDLNYEVQREANTNLNFNYNCWKEFLDAKMRLFQPDLVGISCMFSMTHNSMKDTANHLKRRYSIPIIAGGVHASSAARAVLEDCRDIDAISLYESDVSFANMLDIITGKRDRAELRQIALLAEGVYTEISEREIPTTEIISKVPLYHRLDIGNYSQYGRIGAEARLMLPEGTRIGTVLSNRGCRGSCVFCSVNSFNGKGVRQRTIESVVDEIESLKSKYKINHIMWLDDDLLYNRERALQLFRQIERRKLNITWDASNGLVASSIDSGMMNAAADSGCIYLNLGIESGSPEILKAVKKPTGVRHFLKAAEVLSGYPRIFSRGFLMVGFPDETIGKVKQTIELARKMNLDWYSIQPLMTLPATKLAEDMKTEDKKFTDGTLKCFVGSTGGQRIREQKEKMASSFENLLKREDDYRPTPEEFRDVWFLADYHINFERIPEENNPIKLVIKEKMLKEICERKTKENAMGCLFLSVVEKKLGRQEEARRYFEQAMQYLEDSAFWKARFKALGLEKLIDKINKGVSA